MSKRSDQNGPKSSGFGPRTLLRIFLYHSLDPAQDLEQLREFEALYIIHNIHNIGTDPVHKELYRLLCQKGSFTPGPRTLLRICYHSHDPAQDLEQLREFEALFAEKGYCEETVRAARPNCLNMIVVKLNSGGLLLYCPVQVPVPVFCTQPFSFPVKRAIYVLLQTKAYGIFQCCGSEFIESG